jgi:hypothetical protein
MGFLAPLYALAALAVIAPIVFHLIKRQPQGQMQFSSLMFLSPSPPQLTRRSRLDNLLLLLLRALAIALIAFAFARPYMRQESFLNSTLSGRNIVVLLDTSASMQREDVWAGALTTLRSVIDSLSPEDRIALYTVDDSVTPVVPLDQPKGASPANAVDAVRVSIDVLKPTWRRTELADGLRTVADMLTAAKMVGQLDGSTDTEIVLISDLHAGSSLESLQGYPWPEAIRLDVRQILPSVPGNARASLMLADAESEAASDANQNLRVRIENNMDSVSQNLQLAWMGPSTGAAPNLDSPDFPSTSVQVPNGQVRVVSFAARPAGATHLQLLGDSWDGDNRIYIPQPHAAQQRIACVESESQLDESKLSYFLSKAPLDTALVQREIVLATADNLDLADSSIKAVVVELTDATPVALAGALRDFANAGGTVIVCLARSLVPEGLSQDFLRALCQSTELEITEAKVSNFSLLSSIDYTHPVFLPFADPRFNDFSKIRFWQHRNVSLPPNSTSLKGIARYDDQSPMLIEQIVGPGCIWIMTSGWQPEASTLALSSKFVPILMGMLDPRGQLREQTQTFEVGQPVELKDMLALSPNAGPNTVESDATEQHLSTLLSIMKDQGEPVANEVYEIQASQVVFAEPGLYTLQIGELVRQVAVQVPAAESQQLPLDKDVFAQYGIDLGKVASDTERRDVMRQLQIEELEGKQRLWQWLIAVCIALLAVETWLAGRQARVTQLAT